MTELSPVFVSLEKPKKTKLPSPSKTAIVSSQKEPPANLKKIIPPRTHSSGTGSSQTPQNGKGAGLDDGGPTTTNAPNILAKIRKKIVSRQFYPPEAQRRKITGTVKVGFRILENGELKDLRVIQGSGHSILDQAALLTIKRAIPLPYYPEGIALSLDYRVK